MLLTIILCVLIADFITGIIHWWEDTYGLPTWPIIGPAVIVPNIEHHKHPSWLGTMSTIIGRNYQTVVPAMLFIFFITVLYGWLWPFVLTVILASLGNEVHTWVHRPPSKNNWFINFLHDTEILQSRRQHAQHHKPPFDKSFCTLTNFTNAVLDRIYFWRILETIIQVVFGIKPKRMLPERDGV